MHKRGLCRRAVSVRLSVRLFVTFWSPALWKNKILLLFLFVYSVETNKHIFKFFFTVG